MKNLWIVVFFCLCFSPRDGSADEIHFKNGDLLKGVLQHESPQEIIFESSNLGRLTVSKELIEKLITEPVFFN